MKEIILYNTKYYPYILRYLYEGSISGERLKSYIKSFYTLQDKKIILMRFGREILNTDHITFDASIAWVSLS